MRLRAYVFDDDENIRTLLSTILMNRGYEVEAFADPKLCPLTLDQSCTCPHGLACCDFIISDLNMPHTSGLDFLETQKRKGCKVENMALISGGWNPLLRRRARELGCQVFDKPFLISELHDWLEGCERRVDPNRKLSDLTPREMRLSELRAG